MSSQPEDFYREALKDALSKLQSTLPDDPKAIIAHLEVAQAYRQTEDIETADRYFAIALEIFCSTEQASELDGEALWNYLSSTNLATFDRYFPILFEACEESLEACDSERLLIGTLLSNHIDEIGQLTIAYLQKAISIRSAVRGENHYNLIPLFLHYIVCCERLGCIEQVEEIVVQLTKTTKGRNLHQILARCYLSLTNLYINKNMLGEADNAWQKAVLLEQHGPSLRFAETFGNLINAYRRNGLTTEIEQMVDAWLKNANEESLRSIDPHFSQLVNTFLEFGWVSYAQTLIEKRLKVAKSYIVDYAEEDWRLRLSESYQRSNHTNLSANLFQQTIASMTSKGILTGDSIEKKNYSLDRPSAKLRSKLLTATSPNSKSNPVEINFGFFATQEISFGHNTRVRYFDPEPDVLAKIISEGKTYEVAICCPGTIHCKGNLEIAGLIHGIVEPSDAIRRQRLVTAPLPQDLKPLLPALEQPQSAINISYPHRFVKSGDYVASATNSHLTIRDSSEDKPIRIFLKDDDDDDKDNQPYIFDGRRCVLGPDKNKAVNLQLWYNGTKKLSITTISALVYAPNATVEIARGSHFSGAIVANRIIAEGDNEISIDLSLTRKLYQT